MKYIIIAVVIFGLIKALADGAKEKQNAMPQYDSFPEIHYDKIVENGVEYLKAICPEGSKYSKRRLQIVVDFEEDDKQYYLLKDEGGQFFLREHHKEDARIILSDVKYSVAARLSKEGSKLDLLCQKALGKGIYSLHAASEDKEEMEERINTYRFYLENTYENARRIAYELENKSYEAKMEEIKATVKECDSIDWGDEFDFDPDADNPNVAGSDAWWAEQEFFRDQSLYVNHDWDIHRK